MNSGAESAGSEAVAPVSRTRKRGSRGWALKRPPGTFEAAAMAHDEVTDMAHQMADFFSNAVVKSKAKFKRENCPP
jgi:hypothetical protein